MRSTTTVIATGASSPRDLVPKALKEKALDAAALRPPAAAIVELALSGADGVDLCRQLRKWSGIPPIVLS